MIKKVLIILLLFFLTGCYNYNELNDLAIVNSIGIDKNKNGYLVSIKVANTENKNKEEFNIYKSTGKTIEEALKKINYKCPQKIYLSHLELIVLGNNLVKDSIKDTLNYLLNNNDIRGNIAVLVAKNNNAFNIINNNSSTKDIISLLKNSKNISGMSTYSTLDDIVSNYLNSKKDIIIPTILLKDNQLKLDDSIIFKDDKAIGYINNIETLGYNILTNNIKETIIKSKCKNGYILASINNVNTLTNSNSIKITAKGYASKYNCNINDINKKIEIEIKKIINKTISQAKKYHSNFISTENKKINIDVKLNNQNNLEEIKNGK